MRRKKYKFCDSTDVVVYDRFENAENNKKKKHSTAAVAISSALAASIFTIGISAGLQYAVSRNSEKNNAQAKPYIMSNVVSRDSNSSAATLTATGNEGQVLTVPQIAAKVGPSVVGVINKTKVQPQTYWDPFSGRYYYNGDVDENETVEQGSGSGIIITTDGYIVTNQHVVNGATEIEVVLNTGDTKKAELVGQDTKTDLAVLKIDPGDSALTAAVLGDSDALQVGELAVAIGNPMGMEFSGTVTAGIISAVNRTMTIDSRTYNLIQTDAAINNGNSGGALINQYGEVIGINSVKLSSTGVEGMGFAIAISEAKPIINDLIQSGYVKGRPLVGVNIRETPYGMFIESVQENSGAAEAGLKNGDMILEVDGTKANSVAEINEIRDKKKPGDILKFKILRDGETKEVNVTLKEDSAKDN